VEDLLSRYPGLKEEGKAKKWSAKRERPRAPNQLWKEERAAITKQGQIRRNRVKQIE
jgi:hypothetical protein